MQPRGRPPPRGSGGVRRGLAGPRRSLGAGQQTEGIGGGREREGARLTSGAATGERGAGSGFTRPTSPKWAKVERIVSSDVSGPSPRTIRMLHGSSPAAPPPPPPPPPSHARPPPEPSVALTSTASSVRGAEHEKHCRPSPLPPLLPPSLPRAREALPRPEATGAQPHGRRGESAAARARAAPTSRPVTRPFLLLLKWVCCPAARCHLHRARARRARAGAGPGCGGRS